MSDKSTEHDDDPCLRDMFAFAALLGLAYRVDPHADYDGQLVIATSAHSIADAMLEARAK